MKRHNRKLTQDTGATTIIVVCVMAVVMALSMGLFLTASVLMKTSAGTLAGEQCRIMAVTFSEEIERTLTDEKFLYTDRLEEEAGKAESLSNMSLWHYVKQNISDGSWPYYSETEGKVHSYANSVRCFEMEKAGITGEVADLVITMYWTQSEAANVPERLVIETTATVKGQSCSITDVYRLDRKSGSDYDRWSWKHEEKR